MRNLASALLGVCLAGAVGLGASACSVESKLPTTGASATAATPSGGASPAPSGQDGPYCAAVKEFSATAVGGQLTQAGAEASQRAADAAPAEVKESWQVVSDMASLYAKYSGGGATPLASASLDPADQAKAENLKAKGQEYYNKSTETVVADAKSRCGIDLGTPPGS